MRPNYAVSYSDVKLSKTNQIVSAAESPHFSVHYSFCIVQGLYDTTIFFVAEGRLELPLTYALLSCTKCVRGSHDLFPNCWLHHLPAFSAIPSSVPMCHLIWFVEPVLKRVMGESRTHLFSTRKYTRLILCFCLTVQPPSLTTDSCAHALSLLRCLVSQICPRLGFIRSLALLVRCS